jgi:two-component SAPR family response regulator
MALRIIAVDDERLALDHLLSKLREVQRVSEIKGFLHPQTALEEIRNGFTPHVAFLDIEMYGMNGIELALRFKKELPKINIIFVTGFSEYAPDAFALHASGYITKPVRTERIKTELENLRYPLLNNRQRIRVQTFGNFEIFVDDVPIKFKRSRTKELLAYLVDRKGAGLGMAELAAVLWEERKYDRSLQNQLQVHT